MNVMHILETVFAAGALVATVGFIRNTIKEISQTIKEIIHKVDTTNVHLTDLRIHQAKMEIQINNIQEDTQQELKDKYVINDSLKRLEMRITTLEHDNKQQMMSYAKN